MRTGRNCESEGHGDALSHLSSLPPPRSPCPLRPFRQGSLDCYCGFYAIANAMLRLKPYAFTQDQDGPQDLLRAMMKAAACICSPEELIREGMDGIEIDYVARAAIRHMRRKKHGFKLMQPGQLRLGEPRKDVGAWFTAAALPSVSVILYIEQQDGSHWSVLKAVRGNRALLFDSDTMASADLKRCEPWLVLRA